MANIKVSELTEATTFEDGDYTMIVQANQSKKISRQNILGDIENDISTNASNITNISSDIGDINNLSTRIKTDIVNAINSLVPVVLYTNDEGSSANIILSDDISNYSYYEIYFSRGGSGYSSLKMSTDFLEDVTLITSFYSSNLLRFYMSNISISNTTLTRNYGRYLNISDASGVSTGTESSILIYKVIGYK